MPLPVFQQWLKLLLVQCSLDCGIWLSCCDAVIYVLFVLLHAVMSFSTHSILIILVASEWLQHISLCCVIISHVKQVKLGLLPCNDLLIVSVIAVYCVWCERYQYSWSSTTTTCLLPVWNWSLPYLTRSSSLTWILSYLHCRWVFDYLVPLAHR